MEEEEKSEVGSQKSEPKRWTLLEIVGQLESCNFECEAGPLKNSAAFQALKSLASGPSACPRCTALNALLSELFAADDDYGCGFYNTYRWRESYDKLREMKTPNADRRTPNVE